MILLDSNVLMYAVGQDHPLAAIAADVVALAHAHELRVTPRVLEEFAHIYARRGRSRSRAVHLVEEWSASFGPVEHASEEDIATAFELWEGWPSLQLADALLAAIGLRHGAQLVSADRAFADVADLEFLDLADPDLHDKLRT